MDEITPPLRVYVPVFSGAAFLPTQFPRNRCVAKARCYNKSDPDNSTFTPPQLSLVYSSNTKPHYRRFFYSLTAIIKCNLPLPSLESRFKIRFQFNATLFTHRLSTMRIARRPERQESELRGQAESSFFIDLLMSLPMVFIFITHLIIMALKLN